MIRPCSNCGADVYVRPQHTFTDNYCNMACRVAHPRQWIGYILQHCSTQTVAQMAEHIGIPFPNLRTWCYHFNNDLAPYGLRISFVKATTIARPRTPKPPKPRKQYTRARKPPTTTSPKPKPAKTTYTPPPKKEIPQLPTRHIPINAPGYRWVKEGNKYVQRKIA